MEISEKKYCGKIQNQQHNKALNPKISALVDAIDDAEPTSKYLPKDQNVRQQQKIRLIQQPQKILLFY